MASPAAPVRLSLGAATRVWAKIGLLGFGGPAGQIALMHRELVERRRWIDEERFLHALNYCMLLPGPEAQQLAVYLGWLMHRTAGGLIAGTLFVLPGALAILGLSALYAGYHALPAIAGLFFGLKAAVLAVVLEALVRIGKRALRGPILLGIAALAFVALFFFSVPFPWVIIAAGLLGSVVVLPVAPRPSHAVASAGAAGASPTLVEALAAAGELAHTRPSLSRAVRVVGLGLALWAAPVLGLWVLWGRSSVFVELGLFFSQAAVVTFGGAYAVLSYIAQAAVETHGWLTAGEMLDGLGLAETTPGPLILVVQFVAFLGAFRQPGVLPPLAAGVLGSAVTLWVTFVPCFLWIFLGAPYIEALRGNRRLAAALQAITAAVVGVILNLSIWFALHVIFAEVEERWLGPVRLWMPDLASVDLPAVVLATGAIVAMLRFKVGLPWVLGVSAMVGLSWRLLPVVSAQG